MPILIDLNSLVNSVEGILNIFKTCDRDII